MTLQEHVMKALNERGYACGSSLQRYDPGTVVHWVEGSITDERIDHPFVILRQTDIHDFREHVALNPELPPVPDGGDAYYYRISTD